MVRHASAVKAARQALKHQARNAAEKSKLRTSIKNLKKAVVQKFSSKDDAAKALTGLLNDTQRVLMKAANRGVIKARTASRYVSRLSTKVNQALASA